MSLRHELAIPFREIGEAGRALCSGSWIIVRFLGRTMIRGIRLCWSVLEEWRSQRREVLRKAAGIGRVDLRCHRDTWAYLLDQCEHSKRSSEPEAFRPPAEEDIKDEGDGMVLVPLSGATLAAVVETCREMRTGFRSELEKAVGERVERAIEEALRDVVPSETASGPAAVIVLDDRPVPPTATE